ncbi:uncharacterized protein LOC124261617 [Haliotis rubra]|uniref:uncharacterized protein LOC124261617 n=1 Tax=Haliotis rubra TaxID=36100 RepID=UPI001EE56B3F|nr:uncharacterized protein LOC124261617 [Haliotis rubra]
MVSSNQTLQDYKEFNFNFYPKETVSVDRREQDIPPDDRCLGPNETVCGHMATPRDSDSFPSTGTLEPTVQEVTEKIDRMSCEDINLQENNRLKIQLIDIGMPYRMKAKHNIEIIVLIAEKIPLEIYKIHSFLHMKLDNIPNFIAPCDKPVKYIISHAANPLSVDVDLSKLDNLNASLRLLTKQSVDYIVYIAICQPETMVDISKFLLGYL